MQVVRSSLSRNIIHSILSVQIVRWLLAGALALLGMVNGLTVLLPARPHRLFLLLTLLNQFAPFAPSGWSVIHTGRTIALILGFYLILLALGLARGKRLSWQLAVTLLPFSAVAHLAEGLDIEEAALALALCALLLTSRSFFLVESDPYRVRQGFILLAIGFGLILLYGMIGFYLLQAQFMPATTPAAVLHATLKRMMNLPASELTPLTAKAAWFLNVIPWLSTTALLVGTVSLLRPVSRRWWLAFQRDALVRAREKALELLARYGGETHSFFALSPQNLCYLAPDGEGAILYRLVGNVAVILGDPLGNSRASEEVMRNFLEFCRQEDWQVAIFQAHAENVSLYRRLGLHAFKIGEEAILHPQTFDLATPALANVRHSARRAQRAGITVQWYEGVPPEEVLRQMQLVSTRWLAHKGDNGAAEMGFSMGRLSDLVREAAFADVLAERRFALAHTPLQTIPRLETGIAVTGDGDVCAFATFTPVYGTRGCSDGAQAPGWGWALDLMRRAPGAPPGVIDLLIAQAVERFKERGAEVMSLGVVATIDTRQEMTPAQRQIMSFLVKYNHLLATHLSLWRFKQKFHPTWESRYIVASTALAFPWVALAILRAHFA